jgi:sulfur carrier protein
MITVQLNGEPRHVAAGITLSALLAEVGATSRSVAVEANGELVPRQQHEAYRLQAGDRIEIVTLVGGG